MSNAIYHVYRVHKAGNSLKSCEWTMEDAKEIANRYAEQSGSEHIIKVDGLVYFSTQDGDNIAEMQRL